MVSCVSAGKCSEIKQLQYGGAGWHYGLYLWVFGDMA